MTENVFALSSDKPNSPLRSRAFQSIMFGGLSVGVLDGLAAVTLTILYGRSPSRMFQSIASGLIGSASYQGGWATTLLGVSLHFLIAFIWATIYYGGSLKIPSLTLRPFICGPLYGVVVYFAMQMIVLPLSAIRKPPFTFAQPLQMLQGIIVHILFVGLPIAISARRAARDKW